MTTLRTTLGAQVVRATDGTWCFAGTVDYVGRSMQRHIVTLEKSGVQGYTYERYRILSIEILKDVTWNLASEPNL